MKRASQRIIILAGIAGVGAIAAWQLASVLLLVFAAMVLATILRVSAEAISRLTRLPVRVAVVLVSLVVAASVALGAVLFGASIRSDLVGLVATLPGMLDAIGAQFNVPDLSHRLVAPLQQFLLGEPLIGQVASYTGNVLSSATVLLLVVMAGVYLSIDPGLYRRGVLLLVPPVRRTAVSQILDDAHDALRHWLVGQTLTALFIGTVSSLVFWLLHLPHWAALGIIAGAMEFVPYIGGLIASVPAVLVALSTGDPWMGLWVALACLVIQQLEGNVLSPLIQQWAVRLPPVLGLFAMIALGTVFGPLGVLLATPLTVVAIVLVKHVYVAGVLRDRSVLAASTADGSGEAAR